MGKIKKRSKEEVFNTLTHLLGVLLTLGFACIILDLGYSSGWKNAFGVTFFTCGMLIMFAASTIYHWWLPGRGKQIMRIFDHIGIYIMIASSYTPICIGVVGGALGWTTFGLLWATVIAGACYKITAIDKYPRLSLMIYLIMGWSIVFIAEPVVVKLSTTALIYVLLEGVAYTGGTYFFAHDGRHYFHGIWHIFVLLGAFFHWMAVYQILS